MKKIWLASPPKYLLRMMGTLIGVATPLLAIAIVGQPLEAGSPAFLASIVLGILGFHIPGWLDIKPTSK